LQADLLRTQLASNEAARAALCGRWSWDAEGGDAPAGESSGEESESADEEEPGIFFFFFVSLSDMLGGWVNPHREQQTIPQGQTSIPPKSFSTPTANGQSAP